MEYVKDSIKNLVKQMRRCELNDDKSQFMIIKYSLVTLLRKYFDKKPIVFVSEGALEKSKEINVDLFNATWSDQTKFDKGRKIFHLEHKYTVSDMINDMTANPNQIENILESYEVGWVLKEEDSRLKRTNRKNHDVSYAQAGIIPKYRE